MPLGHADASGHGTGIGHGASVLDDYGIRATYF